MKSVEFARKSLLFVGVAFFLSISLCLLMVVFQYSSNDIKIILTYLAFLLSAGLVVFGTGKFKLPQWAVYSALFALAFIYQFTLSYHVNFTGEGDLQFLFNNAANLAKGDFLSPSLYCATFPGTVTYPAVLAPLMKIFGVSRMVPVILNHAVICILSCCSYAFLKRRMPQAWALCGGFTVALHPFTILYSNTCNAELIFGSLMLLSLFSFEKAINVFSYKEKLLWLIVAAFLCGISTLFRPLAVVMVIAYVLYTVFFIVETWWKKLFVIAELILVLLLFGLVNSMIVKSVTAYDPPASSYGWNLYVGASSGGQWNEADGEEFNEVFRRSSSPQDIQSYFAAKAIERYKDIGLGIIVHFPKKLPHWLSYKYIADQATRHDDNAAFATKSSRDVILALTALIDIPIMFLALAQAVFILIKALKRSYDKLLIAVFYLLGSFIVLMLLEIAPRYTVSYRLLFCLLAVEFIFSLAKRLKKRTALELDESGQEYMPG